MNKKLQIFKCLVCNNIVELVRAGGGNLVCCGQSMKLMAVNKIEAPVETHGPVVEKFDNGVKISVGSQLHPMEEKHHILWIELITDKRATQHFFQPGDTPEAFFPNNPEPIKVRAYCNLHGLWEKTLME